jgi:hypothetical protein
MGSPATENGFFHLVRQQMPGRLMQTIIGCFEGISVLTTLILTN